MKHLLPGLILLAACFGAHREHPASGDDVGPTCGDTTCDDKPANTCTDGDTLRSFEAACTDGACSYPSTEIECGGDGCCEDHCCSAVPSNAADFGDLESTGLVVAAPNGAFDTETDCTPSSALGACQRVERADLPGACVCRADEITIGTLTVTGKRALVLLAKKKVVVTTRLDVAGAPGVGGPGATFVYPTATNGTNGGEGGSFGGPGEDGGGPGGTPAAVYGDPTLVPLLGGMAGRAAFNKGGGGGGALQITAGERIEVLGTINAGGGGGRGGSPSYANAGGAGGGSGGGILVEAPTVIVTGAVVANGGGGGGGASDDGSGYVGQTAGMKADPTAHANGGDSTDGDGCPLYGYVYGGWGGAGATGTDPAVAGGNTGYDASCIGSASYVGGGGGGGGVGRIRINTTTGCQCGGKISPQASFGTLVKQ